MTAYEQAQSLYQGLETTLEQDIDYYSRNHFVIIAPHCIILAKLENEYWFIHLAVGVGCLDYFLRIMPVYRPFVAWSRRGKVAKFYKTENLKRLIL